MQMLPQRPHTPINVNPKQSHSSALILHLLLRGCSVRVVKMLSCSSAFALHQLTKLAPSMWSRDHTAGDAARSSHPTACQSRRRARCCMTAHMHSDAQLCAGRAALKSQLGRQCASTNTMRKRLAFSSFFSLVVKKNESRQVLLCPTEKPLAGT